MARKARKGVELQSERGSEPARSGAPNPHMLAARQAKRGRYTTEGSTVGEVAAGGRAVRQGRASGICDAGEKVHTRTHAHTHTHTHCIYIYCMCVRVYCVYCVYNTRTQTHTNTQHKHTQVHGSRKRARELQRVDKVHTCVCVCVCVCVCDCICTKLTSTLETLCSDFTQHSHYTTDTTTLT
jgi:hypothetical protein